MYVGVNSYSLGERPLEEMLQIIQDDGYDFLEISTHITLKGRKRDLMKRESRPVVETFNAAGVRVGAIGAGNDFIQPMRKQRLEQVDLVKRCVDLAKEFRAPIVRVFGGEPKPDVKEERYLDHIIESLKLACEYATEQKVTLGLENHGFFTNDPKNLKAIIDGVNSPALGLTVDTSNFYWFGLGLIDVHKLYKQVAPLTVYVHAKNGSQRDGWARNGNYTATNIMDGELNLGIFLEELRKYEYAGLICIEYEGPGDKRVEMKKGLKYLRSILK